MSTPSEELLNQRRLRAAEIALATARRRRWESDELVRALRREVADVEAALAAAVAGRERDRAHADAEVASARRAQRVAEQGLMEERRRRTELEERLGHRRREDLRRDDLLRQLAAEQRIRELEAELELVLRRAAEFEYGVRMAALDALKLVRSLVDRVGSVLPGVRLGLPELGRGDPERDAVSEPGSDTAEHGYEAAHPAAAGLDSERLDAALERLRATTPPPADPE